MYFSDVRQGPAYIIPSASDVAGRWVTSTRNTSIDTSHGHIATVSAVPVFVMPEAMRRFEPTAGWHMPTSMFAAVMMREGTGAIR